MNLTFLGDVMPGGLLSYKSDSPLTPDLLKHISQSDLRIATLESALGDDLPFDPVKMKGRGNIIYSPLESARLLTEMNLNVVSLANNHIFDLGVEGFEVTRKFLRENGIAHVGAGMNLHEATQPAIIELNGKKIAFLAYCSYDAKQVAYVPIATETTPGIAPLYIESAIDDISRYKHECDYVIVLPHWGIEYTNFPLKEAVKQAKQMIDAGADLIVGSHTHRPQPHIRYHGKDIYFSLGNGLFPDFFVNKPRPIWYPPADYDLTTIPTTTGYPFPVTEPLRRVWLDYSRVGILLNSNLTAAGIKTTSRFIKLNANNSLELHNDPRLTRKLQAIACCINTPFYNSGKTIGRAMNVLRKIKSMTTRH